MLGIQRHCSQWSVLLTAMPMTTLCLSCAEMMPAPSHGLARSMCNRWVESGGWSHGFVGPVLCGLSLRLAARMVHVQQVGGVMGLLVLFSVG